MPFSGYSSLDFTSRWLPSLFFIRGIYAVESDTTLLDRAELVHTREVLPLLWETRSLRIHLPRVIGKSPIPSRGESHLNPEVFYSWGPPFQIPFLGWAIAHPSVSGGLWHCRQIHGLLQESLSPLVKPEQALAPALLATSWTCSSARIKCPSYCPGWKTLGNGNVHHFITPVQMSINNHQEKLELNLIHSPELLIVLVFLWLSCHNPHID